MEDSAIYHEKQLRQLCALHTLNNIFQDSQAFTKQDLDHLCVQLSPETWINPHRSLLGLGNYDVNILMAALQTKGCELQWWDKRKDLSSLPVDDAVGVIVNLPSNTSVAGVNFPVKRKHWIAIKEFGGQFYNLDSKLTRPEALGMREDLFSFLRKKLENRNSEVFIVTRSRGGETSIATRGGK